MDSWLAKVAAAALTERRSLRSRWRNLILPGVLGGGDEEVRVWIAFSAFSLRILSGCGSLGVGINYLGSRCHVDCSTSSV